MRPLQFLLTCASSLLGFAIITLYIRSRSQGHSLSTISSSFTWNSPSSLFPPSAVISLTDDNSTFFLARPAAFGPRLPVVDLSSQLWIGSGFGDRPGSEGELGCSDVAGWTDGSASEIIKRSLSADTTPSTYTSRPNTHGRPMSKSFPNNNELKHPYDGTNNRLQHDIIESSDLAAIAHDKSTATSHADIQSIQESAEIAGKVVLLSRGGCGFIEKVLWVQRRGGSALVVGDNVRGGALVTMYAQGDTSNITIPSLFTSYTTAHLLSSLMPAGGLAIDESRKSQVTHSRSATESSWHRLSRTAALGQENPRKNQGETHVQRKNRLKRHASSKRHTSQPWYKRLGSAKSMPREVSDSRRPPSSGNNNYAQSKDARRYRLGALGHTTSATHATTRTSAPPSAKSTSASAFVIGVHDWRDPDLVDDVPLDRPLTPQANVGKHAIADDDSITPGSGDYTPNARPGGQSDTGPNPDHDQPSKVDASFDGDIATDEPAWFSWFDSHKSRSTLVDSLDVDSAHAHQHDHTESQKHESDQHEGLWVTLQPTSVSSSPFFDALLVLVVSPLVTLTVVYALLLLRARMRRRRWRAPKSIVERLPVRTYQTISTATSNSSRESPVLEPLLPDHTTPLLPTAMQIMNARPRSHTEGHLTSSGAVLGQSLTNFSSSVNSVAERKAAALLEWKRRYGGRQKECIVCLEEYVPGVSRVMSLPCGHEFHADCM